MTYYVIKTTEKNNFKKIHYFTAMKDVRDLKFDGRGVPKMIWYESENFEWDWGETREARFAPPANMCAHRYLTRKEEIFLEV